MNKISIILLSFFFMTMLSACIGSCASKPYVYNRAAEEAEILNSFSRFGLSSHPDVPQHVRAACPDHVEVKDGKASFICEVTYDNGNVQKFQIDIDNGSRSLKNA